MTRFYSMLFFCFLFHNTILQAQKAEAARLIDNHVKGEILFQLNDNQTIMDFGKKFFIQNPNLPAPQSNDLYAFGSSYEDIFQIVSESMHIYSFHFDATVYDENKMMAIFQNTPSVSAAQFNHFVEQRRNPNDPQFTQQWSLSKINAPSVWDKTTGGTTACGDTIVVGILEYGYYDRTTDDLQANIWLNKGEIPNNNIDDDGNGYVDDYRGVALFNGKDNHSQLSNTIREQALQHGTAVAGVIGAAGNNGKLISGINWNVKLMLISGVVYEGDIIKSYDYILTQHKLYKNSNGQRGAFVPITNFSGGFTNKSPANMPLLCAVYDTLGKYGILNFLAVDDSDSDVEKIGDMPTLCAKESMVAVTASNQSDSRGGYAYNKKYVHLAAPGVDVPVLAAGNETIPNSGTSFATPLTAGAAALLMSMPNKSLCELSKTDPNAAMKMLKSAILRGVDLAPELTEKTITGGRLNVWKAYQQLYRNFGQPIGDYDILKMYPNPADKTLNVVFQLPETVNGDILIVNALGQKMYQRAIVDADLLAQKVSIPTSLLNPGLYFLTIATNKFEVTKKFVVARQ